MKWKALSAVSVLAVLAMVALFGCDKNETDTSKPLELPENQKNQNVLPGGNPPGTIDSKTGQATASPNQVGLPGNKAGR